MKYIEVIMLKTKTNSLVGKNNCCKHKYLKIGDTHEAQYTFRMFFYEERLFNRKDKVSIFILPEILVKNAAINKITP